MKKRVINHTNNIYFLTSIQSISLKLKNYSLMFGWSSEDFVVLCTYNIKHRFTINITFCNHNKTRRTIRTWRERHKKSVVVFFNSFLNFTKSKMRRKWVDWKHESHKKGKLYEQWVSLEVSSKHKSPSSTRHEDLATVLSSQAVRSHSNVALEASSISKRVDDTTQSFSNFIFLLRF